MHPVEERLSGPFHLAMMGLNAPGNADELWPDLTRAARGTSEADVKRLLAPGHWRPVVMGAWFSLKFTAHQIGPDLHKAIGACRGSLTAPPLAVAAAVVSGEEAVVPLLDYIDRDLTGRHGSAGFAAAVVEKLGGAAPVVPDDRDRSALAEMFDLARRLRSAFTLV